WRTSFVLNVTARSPSCMLHPATALPWTRGSSSSIEEPAMRTLSPPDPKLWQSRADWFWRVHDINAGPYPLDLGPRASLLLAELETVFCAGAWASVVIVAWALVEAEQRKAARALAVRGEQERPEPDVDWLREQRNA